MTDPALMMIIATHQMVPNANMSCPFRCGKRMIEYNPELIGKLSDSQFETYLKAEAIRIILKHPYERQPHGCTRKSMTLGSNLVLGDNYDFSSINMPRPSDFALPENQYYEWYTIEIEGRSLVLDNEGYIIIQDDCAGDSAGDEENADSASSSSQSSDAYRQSDKSSLSDADCFLLTLSDGSQLRIPKSKPSGNPDGDTVGNTDDSGHGECDKREHPKETRKPANSQQMKIASSSEDLSSLWDEDSMMSCEIDAIIRDVESSGTGWGSLAGSLAQTIVANTRAKIDYRKVLSGFRASVLSSRRYLTRMRPNRRSGFDNMGSIRRFNTNLLIAVDVSQSITDKALSHFFSIIGKIFKYGIENVDVVQFDCALSEVQTFEKCKKRVEIVGRGGTSFQPVFDYVHKNGKYDGLIIFTDGYAPEPNKPKGFRTKVVWVCDDEKNYQKHKSWMKKTGRSCAIKY